MTRSRNKKGSLSLSINAIVILILAITMLALGIGFIKNLFPDISAKVQEKVSDESEPPAPTKDNPITVSRDNVIGTRGDSEVLKVSFYCDTDPKCDGHEATLTCADEVPDEIVVPTFGDISYRKQQTGLARLVLPGTTGSDICTIASTGISADAKQAQFALTVQ